MTALEAPIDSALLEKAAEAAYVAGMSMPADAPRFEPWHSLSDYWKRLYRVQARAVIELITNTNTHTPNDARQRLHQHPTEGTHQ